MKKRTSKIIDSIRHIEPKKSEKSPKIRLDINIPVEDINASKVNFLVDLLKCTLRSKKKPAKTSVIEMKFPKGVGNALRQMKAIARICPIYTS